MTMRSDRAAPSGPRLSRDIETLLAEHGGRLACDVLVVGSGYGGSFAALELARPGRSVWVVERGREFPLGGFPESFGELPGHVQLQRSDRALPVGYPDALFDIRAGQEVSVLVGCGLGGGSLINAGVGLRPDDAVLRAGHWPAAIRAGDDSLERAFGDAARLLGLAPYPSANDLPKFRALRRLAGEHPCIAVPIAVTAFKGVNAVGVEQEACNDCGNCVTGCNFGAKNTLPMNVIPLACERGARFFTGGQAVRVRELAGQSADPTAPRWRVEFVRTATRKRADGGDRFTIEARTVVLAAGTLGSNEILLRSRSESLAFSPKLGQQFSGNGDAMAFGFGQQQRVDAVGERRLHEGATVYRKVGPTIVGMIRKAAGPHEPGGLLVEDASVPTALREFVGPLLATLALPYRFDHGRDAAFFAAGHDPVSESPEVAEHSQFLLSMGFDRGVGELVLDPEVDVLRIGARGLGSDPFHERLDAFLRAAEQAGGFDGGQYLAEPTWRPLPELFQSMLELGDGAAVTVHPLGGCVMGDDPAVGVVDDLGTVFAWSAWQRRLEGPGAVVDEGARPPVHAGLHVLDGAIVPAAVGVNPLLTIAALSLRAARRIDAALAAADAAAGRAASPARGAAESRDLVVSQRRIPYRIVPAPAAEAATTTLHFTEVLRTDEGSLLFAPPAGDGEPRPGVALELRSRIDLDTWVRDPSAQWTADAVLRTAPRQGAWQLYRSADRDRAELGASVEIARGTGRLRLLEPDAPASWLGRSWRTLVTMATFFRRRGLSDLRMAMAAGDDGRRLGLWTMVRGFHRASRMHTTWRLMRYEIELAAADGRSIRIDGTKRLAYWPWVKKPWRALLELGFTARLAEPGGRQHRSKGVLTVDVLDLLGRGVYQLEGGGDTPGRLVDMARVGTLWTRALMGAHFWSLRGVDYRAPPVAGRPGNPVRAAGEVVVPEVIPFTVPRPGGSGRTMTLALSRYRPPPGRRVARPDGAVPMLLTHGLAHGGEVFTTATMPCCFAAYLLERGHEVWVLDNRMSNRLSKWRDDADPPRLPGTIDDVAAHDIPRAIEIVCRASGSEVVDVFAHCIGAAATAMAVLSGRLARTDGTSRIRRLVLHAVCPWIVPSRWNRMSASLAAAYQDALGEMTVELVPPAQPALLDEAIDRIAASIPWEPREARAHARDLGDEAMGEAICNRLTLFYGPQWHHANLDPRTHRELYRLLGPAHIDMFRHVFFLAMRRRLTNAQGENVYLTVDNLLRHWTMPTLLACGRDNQVFDPEGAARSWRMMDGLGLDVDLFLADGIGHMDFYLGRNAHLPHQPSRTGSGTFETVERFLAQPATARDRRGSRRRGRYRSAAAVYAPPGLVVGPSITYRWTGGGRLRLHAWAELPTHVMHPARVRDPQVVPPRPGIRAGVDDLSSHFAELARVGRYIDAWVELPMFVDPPPRAMTAEIEFDGELDGAPMAPGESMMALLDLPDEPAVSDRGPTVEGRAAAGPPAACDVEPGPRAEECLSNRYAAQARPAHVGSGTSVASSATGANAATTTTTATAPPPEPARMKLEVPLDRPWFRNLRHAAQFRQGLVRTPPSYAILFGSCRWPGVPFERVQAAEAVRAMAEHADDSPHGQGADALWLVGDQIYADAVADLFDTSESAERAASRYREAFGRVAAPDAQPPDPAMPTLLAKVPTWMVVDDHEFADNWQGVDPATGPTPDDRLRFASAAAYQWRQTTTGPRGDAPRIGRTVERGFWQSFEVGHLPVFAMDSRTERTPLRMSPDDWPEAWRRRRMIGERQLEAITDWLHGFDRDDVTPKFILSGSVFGFAPNPDRVSSAAALDLDDWNAFPATARSICQEIVNARVRNVVFVSGDYHLSGWAALTIQGRDASGRTCEIAALSIASSGLNATLPFANARATEFLTLRDSPTPAVLPMSDAMLRVTSRAEILSTDPRQFGRLDLRWDERARAWKLSIGIHGTRGLVARREGALAAAEAIATA